MAFMERQVECGEWWELDSSDGIFYAPAWETSKNEMIEDCARGSMWTIKMVKGYGARLSAPGYLDCTEWTVFDTEQEAYQFLEDYYPEDEEDTE